MRRDRLQSISQGCRNRSSRLRVEARSPLFWKTINLPSSDQITHAPETRPLPRAAQLPAVKGLRSEAPTTALNFISFEPNEWMSTPLLRRPSDPLSNRTKFLIAIAIAVAAPPTGYFIFGNSDREVDVAVASQATTDVSPVEFLPLRQAEISSAKATGTTVESGPEPDVQTASVQSVVPLDIKTTEGAIEARSLQTLPERGKRSFTAGRYNSTCFPSASAVRQNHPGAWPSWTLRAPGHESTRCWYAATRTKSHKHRSEIRREEAVQATEKPEVPVLFGPQY
jgi:hypothetical protein